MRLKKRTTTVFLAALLSLGSLSVLGVPANAHGTGVVKSCLPGTNCITDSSKNAVFAVCNPLLANPTVECKPGRDVTVQLANYGTATTAYLWWLNGAEPDNPSKTDCTKAVDAQGRTLLATVPLSGGKGSWTGHLPPPGGTPGVWSYGANWLCGTTASSPGQTGTIGDQQFAIYPA